MIQLADQTVMVQHFDGRCAPFSAAILREDLAEVFAKAGHDNDFTVTGIVETVEDYLHLHAAETLEGGFPTGDLRRLIERLLIQTGMPDVAEEYRKQESGREVEPLVKNAMPWDCRHLAQVLERELSIDNERAQTLTSQLAPALELLNLEDVSDELVSELGRHLLARRVKTPSDTEQKTSEGILFSPHQLVAETEPSLLRWLHGGAVRILPVRRILPTPRFVIDADALCRHLGTPLTELQFLPALHKLGIALRLETERVRALITERVPHAQAYPARVTVNHVEIALRLRLGATGPSLVRVREEARRLLRARLNNGPTESAAAIALKFAEPALPSAELAVNAFIQHTSCHPLTTTTS